jgi:hypothetical protein
VIEKFNFYDLYGYFLPGLAFLGILWFPFALVAHVVPPAGWSSAIVIGAAAYTLGHVLQTVATADLPSKTPDRQGSLRYPSEMVLDANSEFPKELKDTIGAMAKARFCLDLRANEASDEEIDKRRNSAFLLARQVLVREKTVSYSEQFQGLYAFMRGLSVVLCLAFSYWLGWTTSVARNRFLFSGVVIGLTVTLLILINISFHLIFAAKRMSPKEAKRWTGLKRRCRWLYPPVFFAIGFLGAYRYKIAVAQAGELCLLAGLALLASLHTNSAYRYFAGRFAASVWRDFVAYDATASGGSGTGKVPNDA